MGEGDLSDTIELIDRRSIQTLHVLGVWSKEKDPLQGTGLEGELGRGTAALHPEKHHHYVYVGLLGDDAYHFLGWAHVSRTQRGCFGTRQIFSAPLSYMDLGRVTLPPGRRTPLSLQQGDVLQIVRSDGHKSALDGAVYDNGYGTV